MQGFQIHRYSFMTEYAEGVKKYISCYGYKYLSILTSGAINPLNNTPDQNNNEENFYLTQLGKEKLLINHEIFNHPLPSDIKRLQLVHQKPLGDTPDLEYGYGHYFVVLSDYKVNIPIPKENPYVSFEHSITTSIVEVTEYGWFGKSKLDSSYELRIPYIPAKYKDIFYSLKCNAIQTTGFEILLTGYYTNLTQIGDTIANTVVNLFNTNSITPYTRYKLSLILKEKPATKEFSIQLFWY